jgi:hypothetical protein
VRRRRGGREAERSSEEERNSDEDSLSGKFLSNGR